MLLHIPNALSHSRSPAFPSLVQPQEGRILESASPALAEVRQARRQNRDELRAEMDRWARQLHALGVSERPQVGACLGAGSRQRCRMPGDGVPTRGRRGTHRIRLCARLPLSACAASAGAPRPAAHSTSALHCTAPSFPSGPRIAALPPACLQVVVRRDRLCIPVRAGRQGELPKGSVSLATSASGNTLYMEPAPAVRFFLAFGAAVGLGDPRGPQAKLVLCTWCCARGPSLSG